MTANTQIKDLANYHYRGARTLILLHEDQLRQCVAVWREAKTAAIQLPETSNSSYASLENLLAHLLGAARGYMVWICQQLALPDPEIRAVPELSSLESNLDAYLEHLLDRWRLPLVEVPASAFGPQTYISNWGTAFSIGAMLEHALAHPMRHRFQLSELLAAQQ
jgi:hypothetical protein